MPPPWLVSTLTAIEVRSAELISLDLPRLWQRAEFRVDHAPAAANCFDPDQIRLDASFTPPSGRRLTVPAFWYQDYSRVLVHGAEILTPIGGPQWRIRFTPTEPGDYLLSVSIRTNGTPAGGPAELHFQVPADAPSGQHGFVRIGPDKRYFQTSDGRPLRLVGQNVCWSDTHGTFDYDAWFGAMRSAGENFGRLWMSPWFLGLEHKPGTLNHYDLQGAWQLDYILRQAEESGIYLMLCFDHHGMYQVDNPNWGGSNNFWKSNPYNEINGGPCAKPNDFFTDAKAREFYQKRLRYLVGRYGYSPYLLAWQFFNEIDNVYGTLNAEDVAAWHRQMGQWLHAHDPFGHLVTTSLTGGSERPEIWSLPEMDFSVYHSYYESAPGKRAAAFAQSFSKEYGKPMMIGEFGIDAGSWNIAADPHLRGFRQALWGGALGGSVGTAMSWWWQDMHAHNVYPLFAAMNRILRIAGWDEGEWEPARIVGVDEPPTDLAQAVPGGEDFNAQLALNTAWRLQRRLSNKLAVADPLAAERSSDELSAYLPGKKDAPFQRPIQLVAFAGENARLTIRVKAVYSNAELTVRVDGTERFRTNFVREVGKPAVPWNIGKDIVVDLPPGKRIVEIANNAGEDWVLLDGLKLEQVQAAGFTGDWKFTAETVGLRNANKAVLYLCSPWVVFPASALRYNPPLLNDQTVQLANWPEGRFSARWFDPCTGRSLGTTEAATEDGTLSVPVPAFMDDLAAVISQESGEVLP